MNENFINKINNKLITAINKIHHLTLLLINGSIRIGP